MRFRGGEFSTGTVGNFLPELTLLVQMPGKLGEGGGKRQFGGSDHS
jgi:hypothetical protein